VFIFSYAVFDLPQQRARVVLLCAVVTAAVSLIPAVSKFMMSWIENHIKPEVLKKNKITTGVLIVISAVTGYYISLIELKQEPGILSDNITYIGAMIAVFILSGFISGRLLKLWSYIKQLAAVFRDTRFLITVLLLNAYAVVYLIMARQTFYWDNAGYWRSAAELSELAFSAPAGFFSTVIDSVFWYDYHYLPAVIPAYIMAIFNTGRLTFVLAIINFFVVPFWAMLFAASRKAVRLDSDTGGTNKSKELSGYVMSAAALFVVPYMAVTGFLDVGGAGFAFACAYLFFNSDDDGFLSGLLLCAVMMFRRWYIFYVIAFLICALLYALPYKERRRKLVLMLFSFGAPVFLLFQGYISGVLLRDDFSDIYSAYSFSMLTDVRFILRYFGIAIISGMTIFTIYRVCKRKARYTAFLPLLCCLLIFFIFTSVQSFGMQHLLLFAAPIALICIDASREKITRTVALVISVLSFASIFIPRDQPRSIHEIKNYAPIPSYSGYPVIRRDAAALAALDKFVRGLDGRTAVLASSFTLNSDLLALIEPSFDPLKPLNANADIIHTAAVDKRDGLPYALSSADYIVAALPVQTHLAPDQQRSVVIPAEAMFKKTPFSAAFERLTDTFELQEGIIVCVFERLRQNTDEELEWLWDEIRAGWQ